VIENGKAVFKDVGPLKMGRVKTGRGFLSACGVIFTIMIKIGQERGRIFIVN
jgi:hypothetical protein